MYNISIIAALDTNGLIGKENHLPWNIKEDLEFFRTTTMGHPVVMGKNTWLSIGKPLDGRINIILTRDTEYNAPGCITANSIQQVLDEFSDHELFVIGGAQIFRQFLPFTNKIYLSRIQHAFDGDTFFPEVDWSEWEIVFYEQKTTEARYDIAFEQWDRKTKIKP